MNRLVRKLGLMRTGGPYQVKLRGFRIELGEIETATNASVGA